MKSKQKQFQIKEKKQVEALKDLKLEGQTESIEGIFLKDQEKTKLKMNCIKLKTMKIKVLQIICFMNGYY